MSDVLAGVTLQSIPQDRLIHFGSVTASGSALARLEVQEVMLLSADWQTSGFSIPVCGVDEIGCLASSPDASVQYEDVKILNLHFHANSEHTVTGASYAAEAHLVTNVTVNGSQRLVVFGIRMDVAGDETNDFFTGLQPYIDATTGPTNQLCNVFGARTNNRVLQPLNGRSVHIGSTAIL
ncbi:hypothetical protein COCSUDRAFT_58562 [Coccomyxa subellipsoidea C-169]|uniref:Carbonic anhydrase n=1 Tax=Coccomyxa subellipsoidea (strain C-169) TaxID=574566 RepID=I0YLJ7_COCSC|nr:hypothetical protein COCSUDRAFT_58562 [Coccomyxa subellipsoidea C-169]EIE19266.1 hypothetical protein COCSUDRAFT_58562 [Coccomyxa subellipsoidea C-169]|eukprot:XP_005643810.1 hypothetical protein COCSUDRAFT_58562 [Coccomyxa subellipsoidea C-169]